MKPPIQDILRKTANRVRFYFGVADPACRHERVVWHNAKSHPTKITNQPMEILAASGFIGALATWQAHCAKCDQPILFASNKPRPRDLDANGYFA